MYITVILSVTFVTAFFNSLVIHVFWGINLYNSKRLWLEWHLIQITDTIPVPIVIRSAIRWCLFQACIPLFCHIHTCNLWMIVLQLMMISSTENHLSKVIWYSYLFLFREVRFQHSQKKVKICVELTAHHHHHHQKIFQYFLLFFFVVIYVLVVFHT